jgi:hypothetical protein
MDKDSIRILELLQIVQIRQDLVQYLPIQIAKTKEMIVKTAIKMTMGVLVLVTMIPEYRITMIYGQETLLKKKD